MSAGAPRSKDKAICQSKDLGQENDLEPLDLDRLKDEINSHMVVATVIAAMTFAAGFSIFGAYNDSEPDAGITTLLNKPMYDVFVICNTVAMFSSIISIVIILWRQINDSHAVLHALEKARQPLLTALATMSMAFMAGVYVTFFADYIIRAGISISRSVTVERATWQPHYPLGILNPSAGCPEIDPIPATNVIDRNSKY